MASPLLTTTKVLQSLSEILTGGEAGSSGQIVGAGLQSKQELLAITVHTILVLAGFRFIGIGEQEQTTLPTNWNTESKDSWTFRYTRPDTQKTFLVQCLQLFDNLLVNGTTLEDRKVATLELKVDEFIRKELVYPIKSSPIPEARDGGFDGLFTSERQLERLIEESMNELAIIKMAHSSEGNTGGAGSSAARENRSVQPPPPSYEELYPHDSSGDNGSNFGSSSIGAADLDPLAASPMVGGPGGLRLPGTSDRYYGSGGGMHVGPEHPIFRPGGDTLPDIDQGQGIFGGPQHLPRGSVPPGARFDPIVPFGPNPSGPPRPGRGGSRGGAPFGQGRGRGGPGRGGGSLGPFSGDPDNDELPPPSDYNNMFM
ncbi:PI31 proteasome regulator N-terminal-domain-containing protein [Syncephalis fuscata]|nr:PI31 proteasome regulator N-terminal-domain-containing protein [Syncephalis fuscata]